jgi:ribosomal protein L40E
MRSGRCGSLVASGQLDHGRVATDGHLNATQACRLPRRKVSREPSLLVHLICLRCNRANAPDAKFCSACGAGLLRKFCSECHAVNDAESHFCQSCGATLSAPPSVPPVPRAAQPGEMPGQIDVANLEPGQRKHLVSASEPFYSGPIVAVPPQTATLPAETGPGVGTGSMSVYRMPVLLGLGSVALMVLAALEWPRSESPTAPSDAAPARGPSSLSAGEGTADMTAMPALTAAAVPPTKPASASSDVSPHEAAVAPLPPLSGRLPATGAAKMPTPAPERLRASPTQPRPRPSAPPECTPQVDALGLCEPGANVKGR